MDQAEPTAADEAVLAEYRVVRRRILEQRSQVERLQALIERLEEQVVQDERFLGELEAACGLADQLRIEELDPFCAVSVCARLRSRCSPRTWSQAMRSTTATGSHSSGGPATRSAAAILWRHSSPR